jgi:hypothetical protein
MLEPAKINSLFPVFITIKGNTWFSISSPDLLIIRIPSLSVVPMAKRSLSIFVPELIFASLSLSFNDVFIKLEFTLPVTKF